MEEVFILEKLVGSTWDGLVIIGGIFIVLVVWMFVSRDSSNDQ